MRGTAKVERSSGEEKTTFMFAANMPPHARKPLVSEEVEFPKKKGGTNALLLQHRTKNKKQKTKTTQLTL